MTYFADKLKPGVILASPGSQPPSSAQARTSSGPAARWMAPSTPPPPKRELLAALTMASTASRVISASIISIFPKRKRCERYMPDGFFEVLGQRVKIIVGIYLLSRASCDRARGCVRRQNRRRTPLDVDQTPAMESSSDTDPNPTGHRCDRYKFGNHI